MKNIIISLPSFLQFYCSFVFLLFSFVWTSARFPTCASKCLTTSCPRKITLWFVPFASFHGVNIPTMGNFKLPMWCHWTCREGMHTSPDAIINSWPPITDSCTSILPCFPGQHSLSLHSCQLSPLSSNCSLTSSPCPPPYLVMHHLPPIESTRWSPSASVIASFPPGWWRGLRFPPTETHPTPVPVLQPLAASISEGPAHWFPSPSTRAFSSTFKHAQVSLILKDKQTPSTPLYLSSVLHGQYSPKNCLLCSLFSPTDFLTTGFFSHLFTETTPISVTSDVTAVKSSRCLFALICLTSCQLLTPLTAPSPVKRSCWGWWFCTPGFLPTSHTTGLFCWFLFQPSGHPSGSRLVSLPHWPTLRLP